MKRACIPFLLVLSLSQAHAQSAAPASPPAAPAAPVAGAPSGSCAHVSTTQGAVPVTQDVFMAEITKIDGKSTPLATENRYRLETGERVLTVAEMIDVRHLPGAAIAQIAKMKRHEQARAYKKLTIDAQPGVTYLVGARLLRDRLDADSIRDNQYWEPVVWDQRAERCP
ncbi:hypothetical protein [Pseudoxanthomonas sp. 10H]|uniref:hypothetical protein n=1 Tax=Pseudoxanthomonas sp. 10H TaxID=3242729 RepID=UPI0035575D1C